MHQLQVHRWVAEILRECRFQLSQDAQPVTYGEFAALLSQPLQAVGGAITPQQVFAWETGASLPGYHLLWELRFFSQPNTWQWRLAGDLRAALNPQVYRASSPDVRELLQQPTREGARLPEFPFPKSDPPSFPVPQFAAHPGANRPAEGASIATIGSPNSGELGPAEGASIATIGSPNSGELGPAEGASIAAISDPVTWVAGPGRTQVGPLRRIISKILSFIK